MKNEENAGFQFKTHSMITAQVSPSFIQLPADKLLIPIVYLITQYGECFNIACVIYDDADCSNDTFYFLFIRSTQVSKGNRREICSPRSIWHFALIRGN